MFARAQERRASTRRSRERLDLGVDVSQITKNGRKDKDVALQPGDVVWVPQSFF